MPGRLVLTNKAPYLLWPRGDETDQAYLLGVLSSIPLDWYVRRIIELGMNFYAFNGFPDSGTAGTQTTRDAKSSVSRRRSRVEDERFDWAPERWRR